MARLPGCRPKRHCRCLGPTHHGAHARDERLYRLKADYATGSHDGQPLERWQYKITSGGRIWCFVVLTPKAKTAGRVLLERCEPGHPKETERR